MEESIKKLRARGVPEDRIDEYQAAFSLFDVDSSGFITKDKLSFVLNSNFGQQYTDEDLVFMLKQFGDGPMVDFAEFASSLDAKLRDPRYNEAFGDAFDLFDRSHRGARRRGARGCRRLKRQRRRGGGVGAGSLEKIDLIDGMKKLGETLSEEDANEMLKARNCSGRQRPLPARGCLRD
jgi:Ca2+-binding EF-hand superfamily protein